MTYRTINVIGSVVCNNNNNNIVTCFDILSILSNILLSSRNRCVNNSVFGKHCIINIYSVHILH